MALVSGTANAPVLPPGWTPVNYTGSNHDFSVANSAAQGSNDWKWNYDPSNPLNGVPAKQWANAKDTKGNLWVWVPRYTYRAVEFADDPEVKIRFSSGTTDDTASVDGRTTKKHNAFKFGTTELTGIWVPKYAAHKDTVSGDIPGFKPSQTAWTSIAVNDIFTKCLALKNSITTSPTTGDSHMLKNIEWGAAGMLGKAIGKQRPERNSDNTYKTGHGPGSGSTTTSLDTTGTTSTTGNVTGIFDMVGNTYEYVASYVNNGHANLNTYCASLVAADAKYKDVFPKGASDDQATNYSAAAGLTDGMMIHETSTAGSGGTSWKNWNNTAAYSGFPYSSGPVFFRGGGYGGGGAGLACFDCSGGVASGNYGFRACFVNLNSAPLISVIDATYPNVRFTVSDADGTVEQVEVYVNDTLKQTYTSGLGVEIVYTISYSDLQDGDNVLKIVATDDLGGEGLITLTVNKASITTLSIGTKIVVHGKQYEITNVVNDGVTLELTLDRPLEENVVVNESVEILNSYVTPSADLGSGFEELNHVKTTYSGDQAEEKYELAAEGRTVIFKVNSDKESGSTMEISKPKAIFQYKED